MMPLSPRASALVDCTAAYEEAGECPRPASFPVRRKVPQPLAARCAAFQARLLAW